MKLVQQLKELWRKAGMHPRKWLSNLKKVLAEIDMKDRAKQIGLSIYDLLSVKALGVIWSASSDQFSFSAGPLVKNIILTKKKFLSKILTLFHTLGYVMPFVVRAKIHLQEVWISGIDWDDQFPENISDRAKKWFAQLEDLGIIKIGRCLRGSSAQIVTEQSFHVFSDASEDACAAVMYERNVYEDGSASISFIAFKFKVTPLNVHSTPLLELLGAIFGLHLCQVVSKVLRCYEKVFFLV